MGWCNRGQGSYLRQVSQARPSSAGYGAMGLVLRSGLALAMRSNGPHLKCCPARTKHKTDRPTHPVICPSNWPQSYSFIGKVNMMLTLPIKEYVCLDFFLCTCLLTTQWSPSVTWSVTTFKDVEGIFLKLYQTWRRICLLLLNKRNETKLHLQKSSVSPAPAPAKHHQLIQILLKEFGYRSGINCSLKWLWRTEWMSFVWSKGNEITWRSRVNLLVNR